MTGSDLEQLLYKQTELMEDAYPLSVFVKDLHLKKSEDIECFMKLSKAPCYGGFRLRFFTDFIEEMTNRIYAEDLYEEEIDAEKIKQMVKDIWRKNTKEQAYKFLCADIENVNYLKDEEKGIALVEKAYSRAQEEAFIQFSENLIQEEWV